MSIDFYPERSTLQADYAEKRPHYQTAMVEFSQHIQTTLEALDTEVAIKGRIKSFPSYFEKLLKRLEKCKGGGTMDPIHDIIALRVVCPFLEDVARVETLLRASYMVQDVEHKGEQHTVGEFGYSCTHLVLTIPERIRRSVPLPDLETAEVQIRTILQDAWAEVEHELIYKSRIAPLDTPLRRKLAALNATLSLSDITFQEIRDYQRKLHKELDKRRLSFAPEDAESLTRGDIEGKQAHSTASEPDGSISSAGAAPRSMDEMLVEALHAHNNKKFPTAIELYTRILQAAIEPPLRAIVLIHRGIARFGQARYEQALEDFSAATQCEPDNGKAFFHLGTVYRVLGNHADAVRHLHRSVELNPYRLEALVGLANALFEMGDYPAVLEYCGKALRLDPDMPAALKLRSAALARLG